MARAGLATMAVVDWPPLADEGVFSTEVEHLIAGDGETHGYLVEDRRLTAEAVRLLRHGSTDATFVYLGSVDMAGHGWGATSVEYMEMIRAADACLGELHDAIEHRSSRASEHWLIMVTTDHGHLDPGGHGDFSVEERATFLLYSGDGIAVGAREDARMVDVAPTALAHFGLDTPGELDGRPLIVTAPTAVA